jgi:hypothetical protein
MIQIDGPKRQFYIILTEEDYVNTGTRNKNGQVTYKHNTGKLSRVDMAVAAMGFKKIRIANLPPEVPEKTLRTTLAQYRKIMSIQDEMWARFYR